MSPRRHLATPPASARSLRRGRGRLSGLADRELLELRFKDLPIRIEGTWLENGVAEVQAELERHEIRLRPHVWLSHDWFSPAGIPGVAIPFYLAHPRLVRLERRQMLEVEGASRDDFVRILRHEFGHALQHAFRLQYRARWREVFGSPAKAYPESYRPNPASRRYVQHLRLYYAQSHPVEDFAETFAVWLQGPAIWRRRYRDWPALKKLEFVDELVKELRGAAPPVKSRKTVEAIRTLGQTLGEHYEAKRRLYTVNYPDFYDRDLLRIFSADPKDRDAERASAFLRRNRPVIRKMVARWTGEYQFTLDQVLKDLIGRCRELRLRAVGSERQLRTDFALFLTVQTMHFLYRRSSFAL
jgi:hypothetical protein